MKAILGIFLALTLLLAMVIPAFQVAPILATTPIPPYATVTGANVTPNPLCNDGLPPTAGATVGATYDANSDSGWIAGTVININPAITVNGHTVNRSRPDTKTVVTVSAQHLTATDSTTPMDFDSSTSGAYSSHPTPGDDGINDVTITATASEHVVTDSHSSTIYGYKSSSATTWYEDTRTSPVLNSSVPTDPSRSASTTASYVVDLLPPTIAEKHITPSVSQGEAVHFNLALKGGSSLEPWNVEVHFSGPNGFTKDIVPADSGTFNKSANGIAPNQEVVFSVTTDCSWPIGNYSVSIGINTFDLDGKPFDQIVTDPPYPYGNAGS